MNKYLYFNYYRDQNADRRAELEYCLQLNLMLDFIDGYKIWLENPDHAEDIPKDPRIELVVLDRRMDFRDALDHANHCLPSNSVMILINLDVYLGNHAAWGNIDREFFLQGHAHKAMVCTRHTEPADPKAKELGIEVLNWYRGDYADAYVFQTPLLPQFMAENLDFAPGTAQCDNTMMALMTQHYHTYSWGAKYTVVHVDRCRDADTKQKSLRDDRASRRKWEHRNIPTQQNWQQLLTSGQAPAWTWTWFDISRCR